MPRTAKQALPWVLATFTLLAMAPRSSAAAVTPTTSDDRALQSLMWRSIGPYRGGRVTAVAGVPGQPLVYYFGGTGSGVWKTVDAGANWSPIGDGQLGTGSVGAIAVAPSDPSVLYAGMGEGCIRGNVSHGDGVYKSADGGRTWKNVGLRDSRQIPRIRVHPRDPDLVYVAALGHTFGPNRERGLFRSRDGGATWKNVLFVNDSTGAVDLTLDPGNPRVLYAAFWQAMRTPWSLESGGKGSAIYKSTDGGDTWKKLTGEGLPKGMWGRVGVALSPARPERVWAMIEADEGGLYRSDDAGRTWRKLNDERRMRQRAWYYTHVHADPVNPEIVYVLNVQAFRSADGGRTFAQIGGIPHGDHHDLWIDPEDPRRMVESNDGGANVSLDGGLSWSRQDGQPTGQFYHVTTDDRFPYRVYGAQQDNSTVSIASRSSSNGIGPADWHAVAGCECGYVAPKPGEADVTYGGCYDGYIGRYDHRTGQERDVSVYPDNPMGWGAEGMKYRFQWTFPIVISPHDPKTVYAAGNVLFRSSDEGHSWQAISGDLTRNDKTKLGPSGGPITKDNTSVEYYCTIFAMAESKAAPGVLWTGSDDGVVQVSRDAGKTWTDVTPRELPPWSMISQIDPSPHQPGTAFVAANRYKLDDYRPYAFVTRDYGKSWRKIVGGLPENSFVRVVREDPARQGLLYCGTETGAWFSLDEGARWRPLRMNFPGVIPDTSTTAEDPARGMLPVVPVTDMVIKDDDLVISTQGRGFWILDGLTPLREQGRTAPASEVASLYKPSPAYLFGGGPGGRGVGQNPPNGAVFYYSLPRELQGKEEVTLELLDGSGKLIRKLSSKGDPPEEGAGAGGEGEGGFGQPPPPIKIPAKAGLNRFAWNLRYPDASRFPRLIMWGGGVQGPQVVPGTYQAKLTAQGKSQTQSFEVRKDPRLQTTAADYQARFDLLLRIRDKLTETHDAIRQIRDVRDQLKSVADRSKPVAKDTSLAAAGRVLSEKLTKVEEALYQTKNRSNQDPLNYPIRLNNKIAALAGVIESADSPPTQSSLEVYQDLSVRIDAELATLRDLLAKDLAAFNQMVRDQQIPAVVLKPKAVKDGETKAPGASQ